MSEEKKKKIACDVCVPDEQGFPCGDCHIGASSCDECEPDETGDYPCGDCPLG